jgi:hypothetical protein
LHVDKIGQIQAADYSQAVGLAASRLTAETNVQAEAETLIRGLNDDEIKTLYGVAVNKPDLNPATVRELINKSLLAPDSRGPGIRIAPPVLAAYIRNHPTPPEPLPSVPPATLPEG